MKQKSEYKVGEKVILFTASVQVTGVIVETLFHLDQYLVRVDDGLDDDLDAVYEVRPAEYLWVDDDATEQDNNQRQAAIGALVEELDEVLDELRALSTKEHPVIPFVFFGLVNGSDINFNTYLPEAEFEVQEDTKEVALPKFSFDDDVEDDDLPPPCSDYPNCQCGEADIAMYGHPLQVKDDVNKPTTQNESGLSLGQMLQAALENASEQKRRK